jgi:hypothetical protein
MIFRALLLALLVGIISILSDIKEQLKKRE